MIDKSKINNVREILSSRSVLKVKEYDPKRHDLLSGNAKKREH